ncbi:MAG: IS3 family transposase, partial [Gemmatimonadetes bacterium]|nr:IS3 family transposase [Gemmatimonadota bacterium]
LLVACGRVAESPQATEISEARRSFNEAIANRDLDLISALLMPTYHIVTGLSAQFDGHDANPAAGIVGGSRRRIGPRTTNRNVDARPAPDLVERDFTADGPEQLWVADITYIPTWVGFLYLAVVVDVWSRRVVGWSMASHLRTELVLDAMNMAVWQRRPGRMIHHSDQGTQYTSIAFGLRCKEVGVRPSMGSVGDCYDNAMCESFFASLECELLDQHRFRTQAQAKMAVFDYIEGLYNPRRRHSSIGQKSPINFERLQHAALTDAA